MLKAIAININWHSGLSIYASEKFLKAVGDEYGWLGGIDQQGKLRCVLPFTIVRKMKVQMVRFRIETIPLDGSLEEDEERSFLNSVVEYFRSIRADVIIPASTNAIFRTYPIGAIASPYGTYIIDLEENEEALFSLMSSSHRRKVRLAAKEGVLIKTGHEFLAPVYNMVRDTFKRSLMPFMSFLEFKRQVDSLGENVKIFVAVHKRGVQGGMMIPFSEHSAYYVYGGSILEPVAGAMNMMHWEAIRMFRSLGVKRYDFCGVRINPERGSKQEGLKMFKERFGPKLVQGFMWKCALNPVKASVYSIAIRFLRGGDIVDVERRKLKSG